jgi:hypothetical protein
VKDSLTKLERPAFPEQSSKKRYVKGFKDIIHNHFIETNSDDGLN